MERSKKKYEQTNDETNAAYNENECSVGSDDKTADTEEKVSVKTAAESVQEVATESKVASTSAAAAVEVREARATVEVTSETTTATQV